LFNTMRDAATVLAEALLVILSLVAVLSFVSLSSITLVTRRVSCYWIACFLSSSLALSGWMIFYAARSRLRGGVTVVPNILLLFWFLVLAVLVSAILSFSSRHRFIVILVLALSLAVFLMDVPGFITVIWPIHQR